MTPAEYERWVRQQQNAKSFLAAAAIQANQVK
jgi:hypothetical protein